jgi:hypothetical protein
MDRLLGFPAQAIPWPANPEYQSRQSATNSNPPTPSTPAVAPHRAQQNGTVSKLMVDKSDVITYLQVVDICLLSFCYRTLALCTNEPSFKIATTLRRANVHRNFNLL